MHVDSLISQARSRVSQRYDVDLNAVADAVRQDVTDMAMERVQFAMEQAILGAQSVLKTSCDDYIESLYVTSELIIAIKDDVSYLEYGYNGFQMLPNLLEGADKKMDTDERYRVVPIKDAPATDVTSAISMKTSELLSSGRANKASSFTLEQVVKDMRSLIHQSRRADAPAPKTKEFRTAGDWQNPATTWVHPGFQGVNQLEFINSQLKSDMLDGAVRIFEAKARELSDGQRSGSRGANTKHPK